MISLMHGVTMKILRLSLNGQSSESNCCIYSFSSRLLQFLFLRPWVCFFQCVNHSIFVLYSRILHILGYLFPAISRFLHIRVFCKSFAGSLTLLFLLHNFKHYQSHVIKEDEMGITHGKAEVYEIYLPTWRK